MTPSRPRPLPAPLLSRGYYPATPTDVGIAPPLSTHPMLIIPGPPSFPKLTSSNRTRL